MQPARLMTSEKVLRLWIKRWRDRLFVESREDATHFMKHLTDGKFSGKLPQGSKVRGVAIESSGFFFQAIDSMGSPLTNVMELTTCESELRIFDSLIWQVAS